MNILDMKTEFRHYVTVLMVCVLFTGTELRSEEISRIVGSIDGEPITLHDVKDYLKLNSEDKEKLDADEISKSLRELLLIKMIEKESKLSGIQVEEKEVNAYLDEVAKQNQTSLNGLKQLLKEKGIDFDVYRSQVTNEILRSRLVGSKVRAKIQITDVDILRYVDDHPHLRPTGTGVRVLERILSSKQQVAELQDALSSGAVFREVKIGDFKDLGYISEDDLKPEIAEVVKKLPPNSVSEPIRIDNMFYVVSIVDRISEGELPDSLKEEI